MYVVIVTWTRTHTCCYTFATEQQAAAAINYLRRADPAPCSVTATHTSESRAQQIEGGYTL